MGLPIIDLYLDIVGRALSYSTKWRDNKGRGNVEVFTVWMVNILYTRGLCFQENKQEVNNKLTCKPLINDPFMFNEHQPYLNDARPR